MALNHSPKIVTDGLVFYYDMNNTKKSWIGRPTTNVLNPITTSIARYNNPGFSGAEVNSGNTYKGSPIYELTFQAQDSSYIARLGSNEGFGAYHSMAIPLQANTRYMASIYFKSDHPLIAGSNQGYNNTYSNISGWGQNGTTFTRYQEDGWTRLYTQFFVNVNGYHSRTLTYPQQYGNGTTFVVNTISTQNVDVSLTVQSSGIPDFTYLHAIVSASPSILDNGGLTGLSIVDHGLDTTSFTKLSWPSNIKLKAELPFTYHFRLSVPSTGGNNVNIRLASNFVSYLTAVIDNKFWKVTFNTTNLTTSTTIKTYWACPMIEQHDVVYPSTFTLNTRTNTQSVLDLTNRGTITANSVTYSDTNNFSFNGTSNYITASSLGTFSNYSIELWVKMNSLSGQQRLFSTPGGGTFTVRWASTDFNFHYNPADGSPPSTATAATGLTYNTSTYYNLVATNSIGNGARFYVNGELKGTGERAIDLTGACYFGADHTLSLWANCILPIAKIYSRELSSTEIYQNFNSLRGRFSV